MKKTCVQLPRQTHIRLKKRGQMLVPRASAPALADAILSSKLDYYDQIDAVNAGEKVEVKK